MKNYIDRKLKISDSINTKFCVQVIKKCISRIKWTKSKKQLNHFICDFSDFFHGALNNIANLEELRRFHEGTDTWRCSSQDDVSGKQGHELCHPRDHFAHIKNKL